MTSAMSAMFLHTPCRLLMWLLRFQRLWAAVVLLLIALPRAAAEAHEECMLATMTVRHGDWPVDLEPPFRDEIFRYSATLDYSMDYFSIDVRPASGCEIDHAPPRKTFVQIGGSVVVTLYSKNPETGAKRAYTVTATRLLGSETEIQFLTVVGGELSPIFSPTARTYDVHLSLEYDVARVVYRLRDNEQRIRSAAQIEGPAAGAKKTSEKSSSGGSSHGGSEESSHGGSEGGGHSEESHSEERRLLGMNSTWNGSTTGGSDAYQLWATGVQRRLGATVKEPLRTSGEAQYRDAYQSFMVDVGFSRKVVMAVQCADATQANIGAYTLSVHRPGCSPERPYFDPIKKLCVNFCPSGFYRNEETHRCSRCNTNCKVCDSLLHCQMCMPDTADYTYMVQPDGRCQATVNHLFKKYRWWCIGLAVLLGFLVMIGCVGICQLLGTCGHGIEKKGRKVHTYDSDSDDAEGPPYGARRRLAAY